MSNQIAKKGYKKGFGLLEVLISAVIIIIIMSALVTIGRAALNNNEYLAERAQAIYLAQAGLELTRQIRDTNWIDGNNATEWDTISSNRYALATIPPSESINIGGINFIREINIAPTANNLLPNPIGKPDLSKYAYTVKSKISWVFTGQNKSVDLTEILTNWRPDF